MPVTERSKANLRRGGGRTGMPTKVPQSIKEMVERALRGAGGVDYLTEQAHKNPVAFMGLIGRVMPLQINGQGENGALLIDFRWADAPVTINGDATEPKAVADETIAKDADDNSEVIDVEWSENPGEC